MSYGPSIVSPLAWSPDGELPAHLAPDGRLAVTRVSTGERILTLDSPDAESAGAAPDFLNPATALAFAPDGRGLLAVHEAGTVLWGCSPPVSVERAVLIVVLQGPSTVTEGVPATWTFAHAPLQGPAVHGLRDALSASVLAASLAPAVPATLYSPGTVSLEGVVDSDLVRGSSGMVHCQVLGSGAR